MIPFARVEEPDDFDSQVRKPGRKWLRKNPHARRPRPLWDQYRNELKDGFHNLCGYAAMLDPTGGTVDHYRSYKNFPHLAYEWDNYRFASATMNSSKKNADDEVLDPFEVGEGWFKIILPSLQMVTTNRVPMEYRAKAEYTLTRLKLRDGEQVIRWRRSWYELFEEGRLSLEGLREVAPLIAEAVSSNMLQNQ